MTSFDLDALGAGLVVASARAELEQAARTGAMVVTAPPGTGKTTYVAPLVANLLEPSAGTVVMTQPRRVAARAAASRIAALDHSQIGESVGYTVRGDRRVSNRTRIEVVTPGVLLRRLLTDPGLDGIAAVILDEVHERSLEGDLLLGMLAEVREIRDDLTIVAMSATLDAELVGEVLGHAALVRIPSTLHEMRIDFAPFAGARLDARGVTRSYLSHLAAVTIEAQQAEQCDALVFVPGVREVEQVVQMLRERSAALGHPSSGPLEVLPLHGRVSSRDQDRAVGGRRNGDGHGTRIVVSTALAESSLTVPGVRLVIDSGLAREVRRDQARDMTGLVTVSTSRSSAEQRAGRAARQAPGRAVRVYSEAEFAHMPATSAPEIVSADLTDAALLLAAWGTPRGERLQLPTPPPASAMRQAERVLQQLDLLDGSGRVTTLGEHVAQLPVGAREASALTRGTQLFDDPRIVAQVVAAISDDHRIASAELPQLLRELKSGRAAGAERWRRETRRLEGIAQRQLARSPHTSKTNIERHAFDPTGVAGIVVALARPDWIARRVDERSRTYLLASGTRAALPAGSSLIAHEWLAVHEVQRAAGRAADGTGAVIRLAAPLTQADALRLGKPLSEHSRSARVVEGRVRVREERRLGAIVLTATPVTGTSDETVSAFLAHLREYGLGEARWSEAATTLRARLGLLHRVLGDPWPSMQDAALLAHANEWLSPELLQLAPDSPLDRLDLLRALRHLLPWPEAHRLDHLVPETLRVPSGSLVRIDYPRPDDDTARPIVAVKLQEMFGLSETPRLVDGAVPVLLHLLSPARRPLAVTDDLTSFWNGPYAQVRAEMRGRYPKHPWPEDPWAAPATARTKRAASGR